MKPPRRGSPASRGWFGRHRLLTAVLAVLLLTWFVDGAAGDEDASERPSGAAPSDVDGTPEPAPATQRKKQEKAPGRDRKDRPVNESSPKPSQSREPTPAPEPPMERSTQLVARIVDGDTLELGNGQTVRLVGIDAPEVGECGFQAASDALAGLVLGQRVRLTVSDEARDQYGRLLRYVNVGTIDAGLRLIKRGLAVARYDSRDGYGHHPREDHYTGADAASNDFACPKPATLVGSGGGGGNCAPGYTPCIPPYPPDLDCGDLDGPIQVRGSDAHGLDADGDGVACES